MLLYVVVVSCLFVVFVGCCSSFVVLARCFLCVVADVGCCLMCVGRFLSFVRCCLLVVWLSVVWCVVFVVCKLCLVVVRCFVVGVDVAVLSCLLPFVVAVRCSLSVIC